MTSRKKRAVKMTRPKAKGPRLNYLVTNVTSEEKRVIDDHCAHRGVSVSSFLADLMLKEVRNAPKVREKGEKVTVTLRFSQQELDKLNILSRVREMSMAELLHEGLKPSLGKRQAPSKVEWESVRCWLSRQEHAEITRYLKSRRLSARTYLAHKALKAIGKN